MLYVVYYQPRSKASRQYAQISGGWGPFNSAKFFVRKNEATARRNMVLNGWRNDIAEDELFIAELDVKEPE